MKRTVSLIKIVIIVVNIQDYKSTQLNWITGLVVCWQVSAEMLHTMSLNWIWGLKKDNKKNK